MNKEEIYEHLGYNTDLYNKLADIFELEEDYQDKAWDKLTEICKHIYKIEKENQQLKEQLSNNGLVKTCENCEWFGVCPHSYKEYDYKNIIDELEKWLMDENNQKYSKDIWNYSVNSWVLTKLQELKGTNQ